MNSLVLTQLHYITTLKTLRCFAPCGIIIRDCVHQMNFHKTLPTYISSLVFYTKSFDVRLPGDDPTGLEAHRSFFLKYFNVMYLCKGKIVHLVNYKFIITSIKPVTELQTKFNH